MTRKESRVIALTDKTVKFQCGHEGPAEFRHELNGHEMMPLRPELNANLQKCGECWLKQALDGTTFCAHCGRPIFRGQDCIKYDYGICCLSMGCGPGPAFYMPGIWDGQKFIDGITAGKVTFHGGGHRGGRFILH